MRRKEDTPYIISPPPSRWSLCHGPAIVVSEYPVCVETPIVRCDQQRDEYAGQCAQPEAW